MKPDMSPRAITARLRRVSQLRRLCLSLQKAKRKRSPDTSGQAGQGTRTTSVAPITSVPTSSATRVGLTPLRSGLTPGHSAFRSGWGRLATPPLASHTRGPRPSKISTSPSTRTSRSHGGRAVTRQSEPKSNSAVSSSTRLITRSSFRRTRAFVLAALSPINRIRTATSTRRPEL